MYDVKGNLHEVLGSLPAGVSLVAISKFHPNEFIEAAYAEGRSSIAGASAVAKSYPRFFEDFIALGGKADVTMEG